MYGKHTTITAGALLVLALWSCLMSSGQAQYSSADCPPEGTYSAHHPSECQKYFLCVNGTLTLEECPNGLLYTGPAGHGAVHDFCTFRWNVKCEGRSEPGPLSSPGCSWQWGYFPEDGHSIGTCSIFYSDCKYGVPERKECHPPGLMYDDRIKGCNWPDQLGCPSENLLGFRCPDEDKGNVFWPYPRYYYTAHAIITCVNGSPRLIHCQHGAEVDPNSLTCIGGEEEEESKKKLSRLP